MFKLKSTGPRFIAAVIASLAILGAVSACGEGASGEGGSGSEDAADERISFIYGLYPPYVQSQSSDKETAPPGLTGEIVSAIVDEMGISATYEQGTLDAAIPGIQAGRYDMYFSGSYDTEERQAAADVIDFLNEGSALLVPAGNPENITQDTMCGHAIAVTSGTSFQTDLLPAKSEGCVSQGEEKIEIVAVPSPPNALTALKSGRADAELAGAVAMKYTAGQSDGKFVLAGEPFNPIKVGFILEKGGPWTKSVQSALQAIIDNGIYADILKKYGVEEFAIECAMLNSDPESCG